MIIRLEREHDDIISHEVDGQAGGRARFQRLTTAGGTRLGLPLAASWARSRDDYAADDDYYGHALAASLPVRLQIDSRVFRRSPPMENSRILSARRNF